MGNTTGTFILKANYITGQAKKSKKIDFAILIYCSYRWKWWKWQLYILKWYLNAYNSHLFSRQIVNLTESAQNHKDTSPYASLLWQLKGGLKCHVLSLIKSRSLPKLVSKTHYRFCVWNDASGMEVNFILLSLHHRFFCDSIKAVTNKIWPLKRVSFHHNPQQKNARQTKCRQIKINLNHMQNQNLFFSPN